MNAAADHRDVERFRVAVARRLGLRFEDARLGFLAEVLQRRLGRVGTSAAAYLDDLEAGTAATEPAALARELTVGETYFFRNSEQFAALADIVLPDRVQARADTKTLRILSAGCASGEEAYSIAIVLRAAVPDPAWDVEVRAVDLNPAALERAAEARYSAWALRETPAEVQRKWFHPDGRDLILDAAVRAVVHFEERNLIIEDAALWQPRSFDVVFCRNVMMYFAPEQARSLLARIARSLRPGGWLFLGHAETLRSLSEAFHLRQTHGTFYYQRREDADCAVAPATAPADRRFPLCSGGGDRVTALVSSPAPAPRREPGLAPPADLAAAFALLHTERFAAALALVRQLPSAATGDPDVLLLTATLLAHNGQPSDAEETCRRLLLIDDRHAGAHYLIALCREAAGDRAAAAAHDRAACCRDSAFAMPRLHLELLAKRAGDREAARCDLARALLLLQREDPSRLLLFGGGFSRDALLALCRAALRDCGGA